MWIKDNRHTLLFLALSAGIIGFVACSKENAEYDRYAAQDAQAVSTEPEEIKLEISLKNEDAPRVIREEAVAATPVTNVAQSDVAPVGPGFGGYYGGAAGVYDPGFGYGPGLGYGPGFGYGLGFGFDYPWFDWSWYGLGYPFYVDDLLIIDDDRHHRRRHHDRRDDDDSSEDDDNSEDDEETRLK